MKTLFVAIASMILSQTVMAQKEENKPVPKEVIKAHSMKFPDGELKKWEARNEGYIAKFTRDGKKYFAYYSHEGKWKGTESRVKWTRHLPGNVQTGWINSGYAGWYVHNIKKIETPERPLYVLHVNNGTTLSSDKYDAFREDHVLYFTAEGELIKTDKI
ncbi:MAG TPA: PepSY-like domain-containing protein [Puia sp.]|jgi:hypothetical protein|nr:PepSY-like domain-containing protein [Puia sp.]